MRPDFIIEESKFHRQFRIKPSFVIGVLEFMFGDLPGAKEHIEWFRNNAKEDSQLKILASDPKPDPPPIGPPTT